MTNNLESQAKTALPPSVARKIMPEAVAVPASPSPVYGSLPFKEQTHPALASVDTKALAEAMAQEFGKSPHSVVGKEDTFYEHILFTRPEMVEMARKAGKKHILLEWPYYYQQIADQLWEKKITPDQFVKQYLDIRNDRSSDMRATTIMREQERAMGIANLITRGREAGIQIGFIDPVKEDRDLLNPHTGCMQGYGYARDMYLAWKERLASDFNKSIGKQEKGSRILLDDMDKFVSYAEANKSRYRKFFDAQATFIAMSQQRVSGTNPIMAQLVFRQTRGGDPFILFVGASHTEGADSVPEYLKRMGYKPRTMVLDYNEDEARNYYANQASRGARWLLKEDFSNAPDSVLLFAGNDGKPQFYVIPPDFVSAAKEITIKDGYATPIHALPKSLDVDTASLVAPKGSFAKSLTCDTPARPKR